MRADLPSGRRGSRATEISRTSSRERSRKTTSGPSAVTAADVWQQSHTRASSCDFIVQARGRDRWPRSATSSRRRPDACPPESGGRVASVEPRGRELPVLGGEQRHEAVLRRRAVPVRHERLAPAPRRRRRKARSGRRRRAGADGFLTSQCAASRPSGSATIDGKSAQLTNQSAPSAITRGADQPSPARTANAVTECPSVLPLDPAQEHAAVGGGKEIGTRGSRRRPVSAVRAPAPAPPGRRTTKPAAAYDE